MTEKEKILLQREAYINGILEGEKRYITNVQNHARKVYPLPKELREVKIGNTWYRWNNNRLEYRADTLWHRLWDITPDYWSADELSMLADLKRNPYVEVDDD